MPAYTVTVDPDYTFALAFAQETYAANWAPDVPEGGDAPPPPTVEQMPQVLVDADLTNRLREMEQAAAAIIPTLQGITDPTLQEQVLVSMVHSPAMQDYIRSKL